MAYRIRNDVGIQWFFNTTIIEIEYLLRKKWINLNAVSKVRIYLIYM